MTTRKTDNRLGTAMLVVLAATGATASVRAQGAQLPPALELRIPKGPTAAGGDGETFLAYELHVTNFAPRQITLKTVEVRTANADGAGSVLYVLSDSALARATARPGVAASPAERLKLAGGTRAVVHMWVPLAGQAPAALVHRVTIEQGSADSVRAQSLDGGRTDVVRDAAVIGAPLRGGVWLTANGPAPESGHRRALIPVHGTPAIAQRFAIDYVKVGADDKTFTGDQLKNASYHAYGAEAIAVTDGIVVAVKDSIPENVPGPTSRAVPITLETVGGNHVIIDIGGERYAFYAHLQPGSLRVKRGDRVRRGQVVGLVGNSGNSTEPHLHFHLTDANSPLGSEGLPYRQDFELIGRCRTFNIGCTRTEPGGRRAELPMANLLIRFPE